ncbi:hypothetical protein [Dyadobacter arcticus]|uniref:Uncharacterized protein n=1 Tax=Dyadobacter arcticus TaxID=1078754 RepID=A0ABX0UPH4_9BACT|nr:hypothetical protein [Dyadobacter arcticus]NIJ53420.1 hypothetical protein [Dyadobacter arcticus]
MNIFAKCQFAIVLFSFVFAGCKDEEVVVPKSNLTFEGKDYELANGILIDFGKFPPHEGSGQELFLSSSGVTVHETAGKIDSIYGAGHAIFFQLFTAGVGELGEGEYTFDYSQGPFKTGSFVYSYAVFNADFVKRAENIYEMIQGTVTVKKDKTDYVITFDCIEDGGKHITGFFKGPLKVYDEK